MTDSSPDPHPANRFLLPSMTRHWEFLFLLALFFIFAPWSEFWLQLFRLNVPQLNPVFNLGEFAPWQLFTAHFIHGTWGHLGLNVVSFCVFYTLCHDILKRGELLTVSFVSALLVSSALILRQKVGWYVGYSGIFHGVVVYVGAYACVRHQKKLGLIVLAAVVFKIVEEQWRGPSATTEQLAGLPVIIEAHLFGFLAGVFCLCFRLLFYGVLSKNK